MNILIDLDQTIIDSSSAQEYRDSRNWQEVYKLVPGFDVYDGMAEFLLDLKASNSQICIVTSSPSKYCKEVLSYHNIPHNSTVCFHDTQRRKPYPDPILLGLQRIQSSAENTIMIGDAPNDVIAGKSAKVLTVGAFWGCVDYNALHNSKPDICCYSVDELRQYINSSKTNKL